MPVAKISVAPLCAASGGGLRELGGAAHRQQRRALVADRTGDVEQAAEHRLADRHLERSAGGVGDDATPQSRGRLQRDGANRRSSRCDCTSAMIGAPFRT